MDPSNTESTRDDSAGITSPGVLFRAPARSQHTRPEQLRRALDELQQVAENAIVAAVNSDLSAAIGQAEKTIAHFNESRQLPDARAESRPSRDAHSESPAAPVSASCAPAAILIENNSEPIFTAGMFCRPGGKTALETADAARRWCRDRWSHVSPHKFYRAALSVVALLLLTGVFAFVKHVAPARPAAALTQLPDSTAYSSDPQDTADAQVLTVFVRPGQTLQDLSLLYIGHFDDEVLKQIRALNPQWTDTNQIAPGQLLRLPLPRGTLKKVTDTAETARTSHENLFAHIAGLWRARN